MRQFWETLIQPMLLKLEPRVVMEIGSFRGDNTEPLLNFCRDHGATLHAIDPLPLFDVEAWQAEYGDRFVFHRAKSLDALRSIEPADAVLIDGDHNWYTVYHELKQLAEVARRHGRPFPIALFHDIGWPYARRDLYYDPDDIPPDFRQPHRKSGILPDRSELHRDGVNDILYNAETEGGPRNGVLTAVEDFVRESDEPLTQLLIPGFNGLGLLYPTSIADRSPALAAHLAAIDAGLGVLGGHISTLDDQLTRIHVRSYRQNQKRRSAGAEETSTDKPSSTSTDSESAERRERRAARQRDRARSRNEPVDTAGAAERPRG